MKEKLIFFFIIFNTFFLIWGAFGEDIIINSCQQFMNITNNLNDYFDLGADIDCKGIVFTSIGSLENPFKGRIDGNYYTIKNIKIIGRNKSTGIFERQKKN